MNDIKIGYRVTWLHRRYGHPDERMVGTVIELKGAMIGPYAWVSVEDDESPLYVRLDRLTRLAPRPIEAVVDDYTFAVGLAGSLGGVELS